MKIKRILIGVLILALTISGCGAKAERESQTSINSSDYYGMEEAPAMEAPAPVESFSMDNSKTTGGLAITETEVTQMVIMNADLSIAVDDPAESLATIQKMATEMGGFTVSSNLYKTQTISGKEVPEAYVTIRVPAEDLDEALEKIKALTGNPDDYVLSETISGQDVTQEYTDLQSRLRNLEEADAKLSEFYEKATETEDALAIYNQKMQVTEQIEVLKGQIQYYEQAAAKSAINIHIQAKETIAPVTVAGWKPSGVARDALQALIDFGKGLVNFLIWVGILIIPILVVIGLPIFFFVRWLVRRNRRAQSNRPQATVPIQSKDSSSGGKPPLPPM
ncbi:MAG: DUF4349 domain-containing protein [Anaerolineaceae bacterium]|nr:DUF4349 domain-containing protein [Anaerolineaceae bacterium]